MAAHRVEIISLVYAPAVIQPFFSSPSSFLISKLVEIGKIKTGHSSSMIRTTCFVVVVVFYFKDLMVVIMQFKYKNKLNSSRKCYRLLKQ